MWAAILKYLKLAASSAAKLAKAGVKTAIEHPVKTLLKAGGAGAVTSLYDAFAGQGTKTQTGETNKPELSSAGSAGEGGMGGAGQGIGGIIGQSGVGENQGALQTYQPDRTPIPFNYQQFNRNSPMQYVPGPNGGIVGGVGGDVMQGYGMNYPKSPTIPQQYMDAMRVGNQVYPPTQTNSGTPPIPDKIKRDIGFLSGVKRGGFGMPQPEGLSEASLGRQTAQYAGELLPSIIMNRLGGVASPNEASAQQQGIETNKQTIESNKIALASKGKPSSDELYKMAQQEAFKLMGGSSMYGLKFDKSGGEETYNKKVQELYEKYLKQFGLTSGGSGGSSAPMESQIGIPVESNATSMSW